MDAVFDFSLEVTRWLQATFPQWGGFFQLISELGREEFYLVALPIVYWVGNKQLGRSLLYLFAITVMTNGLFKHALRGPRPFWLDTSLGLDTEPQYGVPSAHMQMASVCYLFLAGWFKRRWLWFLAGVMAILMGLSRIYLGVHFVQDVLVAFLLALLVLLGYVVWQRRLAKGINKRIMGQRLLFMIAVPMVFAVVYTAVRLLIGAPDLSLGWADYILLAEIEGIELMATGFGLALGFGVAIIFEGSRVRFRAEGALWKRAVRYVVGMVGLLLIWGGLRVAFASIEPLWAAIPLRILRYGLAGAWVGHYARLLFVKLRLAEADPEPGIQLTL